MLQAQIVEEEIGDINTVYKEVQKSLENDISRLKNKNEALLSRII